MSDTIEAKLLGELAIVVIRAVSPSDPLLRLYYADPPNVDVS
jgi:hypothetical protein